MSKTDRVRMGINSTHKTKSQGNPKERIWRERDGGERHKDERFSRGETQTQKEQSKYNQMETFSLLIT